MNPFYFLIFFIILSISSVLVFAESPYTSRDKQCINALEGALMFPDDDDFICMAKYECNELAWSIPYIISVLENNYIVKQFIYNNPEIQLDGLRQYGTTASVRISDSWEIRNESNPYPVLHVTTNVCGDAVMYSYHEEDKTVLKARSGDFEKVKYDIIKAIMGKHPSPPIQMSEFNISPNEIHCNNDLKLYMRDNIEPICIKEQTYETLLERGFNIQ